MSARMPRMKRTMSGFCITHASARAPRPSLSLVPRAAAFVTGASATALSPAWEAAIMRPTGFCSTHTQPSPEAPLFVLAVLAVRVTGSSMLLRVLAELTLRLALLRLRFLLALRLGGLTLLETLVRLAKLSTLTSETLEKALSWLWTLVLLTLLWRLAAPVSFSVSTSPCSSDLASVIAGRMLLFLLPPRPVSARRKDRWAREPPGSVRGRWPRKPPQPRLARGAWWPVHRRPRSTFWRWSSCQSGFGGAGGSSRT
mmetsp:Transcript_54344/g.150776  ORF Transcript_54344/g.150776 Transcript_54344/m.150776 type:complete len:256 (-) Transcript_54344:1159-1926(-)